MTTDNMPPRMTPERALELHGECVAKYKLGKKSVMTTDNMPPQNAMRCDYCNINFADRQPGSVCPKCYRELSRIAVTMTTDNMQGAGNLSGGPSAHTSDADNPSGTVEGSGCPAPTDNMPPQELTKWDFESQLEFDAYLSRLHAYARAYAEQQTKKMQDEIEDMAAVLQMRGNALANAEQETKALRDLLERAADMISHDTGLRREIDAFLKDKP